jgi:hypothetical protein
MSEAGDYKPAAWSQGHDFRTERRRYDEHVGRSYTQAVRQDRQALDLIPERLTTNCLNPLAMPLDETGSMGEWFSVIRGKLGYVDHETKEYLGQDLESSFCGVGDAFSDRYALQPRPFGSGEELMTRMTEIVHERKGGPGLQESYELAALYYARRVDMPKAVNPLLVFVGDEAPYEFVDPQKAQYLVRETISGRLSTAEVFEELKRKWAVYLIRKPYHVTTDNIMSDEDQHVYGRWAALIGEDHIADLPLPDRVVDVLFGIMAKHTGRIDYFHHEIETRQRDDQGHLEVQKVKPVYAALETIHGTLRRLDVSEEDTGRSRLHRPIADAQDSDPLVH